jgi:tetrahydromethanopterin S-methyltransferase subunit G
MKTMQPWWQQPFFQVALPIMVMFALTYWAHNRRIDDLNRRIDDLNKRIDDLKEALSKRLDAIERRLERIEHLLADHDRRITALEERTSPLRR